MKNVITRTIIYLTSFLILTLAFLPKSWLYAQDQDNLNINASVQGIIYYTVDPKPLHNISEHSTIINLDAYDELGDNISNITFKLKLKDTDSSDYFFSPEFQFDVSGKAQVTVPYDSDGTYEIILYHQERRTSHLEGEKYLCHWNQILAPIVEPLEEKTKIKEAILKWNEPEDPNGPYDYSYKVQISTDPNFSSVIEESDWITATEYDFSHLDKRVEYYFRVKAKEDNGGTSAWSISQSTTIRNTVGSVITDITDTVSDGAKKVAEGARNITKGAGKIARQGYKKIGENVVKTLDPVLRNVDKRAITASSQSVMAGSTVVNLWLLSFEIIKLPYFFFQIILNILGILGFRKKGSPYGLVYDSVTKEPISKAIIRFYNQEGRLARTDVTNIYGVFTAELDPGKYRLQVNCPGYKFPSELLSSKSDHPYENLYYGGFITIKDNQSIDYSIPMDPIKKESLKHFWVQLKSQFGKLIKVLSPILLISSFFLSLYLVFKYEDLYSDWMLLIYLPSFLIAAKTWFVHIKKFGFVKDSSKNKVNGLEIGIKELEYDRLVGKRVTNEDGLYRFILPPGSYQLEVLDSQYQVLDNEESLKIVKEGKDDKPIIINKDLTVDKKKGE